MPDEWAEVGVGEDVVEGVVEVLLRGCAGGRDVAVEQLLGAHVVLGGDRGPCCRGRNTRSMTSGRPGCGSIGPAGVDARELGDGELRVDGDGDAVGVELGRAVLVEEIGAGGEEL